MTVELRAFRVCGCGAPVIDCPVSRSTKKVPIEAHPDGRLAESEDVGTYQEALREITPDPRDRVTVVEFVGSQRDAELPLLRLHRWGKGQR